MRLEDKEWAAFVFEDVFDISSTKSGIDKNKLVEGENYYPYITRSDSNNGMGGFVANQIKEGFARNEGNVISIGLDTQTVFYQPFEFYTGQNIQILTNADLNENVAKFLIPLIKRQIQKFSWGSIGATLTRLKRTKILLPINSEDKPDYDFMEAYMKAKEKELLNRYKIQLDNIKVPVPLEEKKWGEFFIGKIFKLSSGRSKGLNHLKKLSSGGVNYLGATNLNNGVLTYVEEEKELMHKGNAICFIRNGEGSMGYSIYKAEDFIATSDISVGYADFLNKETGLFITTVADKVRGKYNFGYKRSGTRLKKERILLPITEDGKPDYDYMENYMRYLGQKKLKQYYEYKLK